MLNEDTRRVNSFKKSAFTEKYLSRINESLIAVEKEVMADVSRAKIYPPIFITGVQRSGTTLLNQLIINNFDVAYPTNFISRFWKAPILGSLLYKNLNLDADSLAYTSELGYTKGLSGPHEFGYFWRYWFPKDTYEDGFTRESRNDLKFADQLKGLSAFHEKPLLFKNLHKVCFHVQTLARIFPESIFINIERDPLYVAQSTYESRLKLFGSEQEWFGLKPPQFPELLDEKPVRQIVKQIYYCRKYISDSLRKVDKNRQISLVYEEVIADPDKMLDEVAGIFQRNGLEIEKRKEEKAALVSTNKLRLDESLVADFKSEIQRVFS